MARWWRLAHPGIVNWYPTGEKISDADYAAIPLTPNDWHGEWNYAIAQSNAR